MQQARYLGSDKSIGNELQDDHIDLNMLLTILGF
jgi:hypothetical protein